MTFHSKLATVALLLIFAVRASSQVTAGNAAPASEDADGDQWSLALSMFGYLVPDDRSYASPTFTADHKWLHLEARYNYENQETGSLWAGYNFSVGHKLTFEATPMLGAVFGQTAGIAPGANLALTYKKLELSSQAEYVFDFKHHDGSFFYSWNELVYSPVDWFHAGLVAQRTRAYQTPLDVQRGFSVGFAHKNLDFTTYVLNAGWTTPTVVLSLGVKF